MNKTVKRITAARKRIRFSIIIIQLWRFRCARVTRCILGAYEPNEPEHPRAPRGDGVSLSVQEAAAQRAGDSRLRPARIRRFDLRSDGAAPGRGRGGS